MQDRELPSLNILAATRLNFKKHFGSVTSLAEKLADSPMKSKAAASYTPIFSAAKRSLAMASPSAAEADEPSSASAQLSRIERRLDLLATKVDIIFDCVLQLRPAGEHSSKG